MILSHSGEDDQADYTASFKRLYPRRVTSKLEVDITIELVSVREPVLSSALPVDLLYTVYNKAAVRRVNEKLKVNLL